MSKTPYKLSPSQVLYQRKLEGVLPLTHSEWNRLKDMVGRIKCPNALFNTLGSICVGLFTSSLIALFTFNKETENWCRVIMICICILSFILAIVFFALFHSQKAETAALGHDVLKEMTTLEKQFDSSIVEGKEYPLE